MTGARYGAPDWHAALSGLDAPTLAVFRALSTEARPALAVADAAHVAPAFTLEALERLAEQGAATLETVAGWRLSLDYAHLDTLQRYSGGRFWTECACGQAFAGDDPDAADAAQAQHRHLSALVPMILSAAEDHADAQEEEAANLDRYPDAEETAADLARWAADCRAAVAEWRAAG